MKINISGLAWFNIDELTQENIEWFKSNLTITQRVSKEYAKRSKAAIVELFVEDNINKRFGIPREFFFDTLTKAHEVSYSVSSGDKWPYRVGPVADEYGNMPVWADHVSSDPTELTFFDTVRGNPAKLKPEQEDCKAAVIEQLLRRPASGAIIQCPTAFGKTICALAIAKQLKVKTAVLVHREFLLNQWIKRINQFLPDAKVGVIGGKRWDVDNCHIVIVLIETISSWVSKSKIRPELANMFGFICYDEVHRAAAPSWGTAIPEFNAAYRLGISASPTRSDGLEKVFNYHIGKKAYTGVVMSHTPKIRRVWSNYKINHPRFNVGMMSMEAAFKLMSADAGYNQDVIDQIKAALAAGRKIMVFSHTVKHLELLNKMLLEQLVDSPPTTDFYIGGRKQEDLDEAENAMVLFGTFQMAKDSLDIPSLDTVILAGPIRNPQQPAGRACRDFQDKKPPVVVDMRADNVPIFKEYGQSRDRTYERIYGVQPIINQVKFPGIAK